MIIGMDPGLKGGLALLDDGGNIVRCDPMPLVAKKISAQALAAMFREYELECSFERPNVVIEEIYTLPSDALPQKGLEAFRALFHASGQYLTACDGDYASPEHVETLRSAYKGCTPYADGKMRVDGRKGLLSYAKGAGMLQMVAMLGWPVSEVKPSIWCRDIKQGVDRSKSTKDQSMLVAQSLWPREMETGGKLWRSDRCKTADEGMVEAALIAEWGRRKLAKISAA